jgi:putative acetyltransferase
MDFTVSEFTMDSYDEVAALWRESEGVGMSEADSPENIRSYLARNPAMSFVARADGRLVGAVLGGHDGRRGLVHHLVVHRDARRKGIGRKLVDECLRALADAGMRKCLLFVFHANDRGAAFWKALGWSARPDVAIMSKDVELTERDNR